MRDENGQFIKGYTGNPLGRPKRADEEFLVDLWTKHGQQVFAEAVRGEKRWAIKLLVDKLYANKKEVTADISIEQRPIPIMQLFSKEDEVLM
jgi:hypothetical protein